MKANGKQDKPGGWYYLTDEERDFVVMALEARLPRRTAEGALALYDTLANKRIAPEPVFSSADHVVEAETRSKM